ncbi:MAG: amidohydrolase family protein [Propionibacteriaceae bacterium]|jgi:imidazolonepropionase-like amidohydrolase|nr:amidohydrolase family protein [Propionibacteriaceae bacterium]
MTDRYHIHGVLPSGEQADLWVEAGKITYEPLAGAQTLATAGWILPGLVDAHCHVGIAAQAATDQTTAEANAKRNLASGVTLVREPGSPLDTHWLDGQPGYPRFIRAGRHIARTARYLRGYANEVDPADLVEAVRTEARAGDGWVKLVGDWIDRDTGDLTAVWPEEIARQAILAAHEEGAQVTAHCFGEDSVAQLVAAGIDCIEHGSGLDESTIKTMAERGTPLVPTLDNLKIFPGLADQAEAKFPIYAAHMRALYDRRHAVFLAAYEAGVPIYAGTDSGGFRAHGTILDEILALATIGGPEFALAAASWRARTWLGALNLEEGAPADLIVTGRNPHQDLTALKELSLVMVAGVLATP